MVLDADGRYVKIAPTNPINLYQSPDEMLGKTVHEILPKEQADYIVAKTREAIQTGRVVPAEYALQIGGKEVWFSCNATRLSENTALWVAHDITKRKQAEEVLVHQAQVMNQVHEAIIVCDLNLLITEWNVGAETMFGYSAEEMLGKPFSSIYPDDQRPSLIEEIQPQVRQKGWHEFETRLHRKSGQEFATHVLITALKDSKGRIVGFAGSAIDITESKQAEKAIAEERSLLRTLIDNLPDYVYVKNSGGQFVVANTAVVRQLGFTAEDELVGKSDWDVFPPEQAAQYFADEQKMIQSGQELHDFEGPTTDVNKEVKDRWVSTVKVLLRDTQGKITGFVGIGRDITERKQAEQVDSSTPAELETLYESGLVLGQLLSPKEIAQKLIDLMGAKLHWHHTTIRLYHPEDETLELLAFQLPTMMSTAEYAGNRRNNSSL